MLVIVAKFLGVNFAVLRACCRRLRHLSVWPSEPRLGWKLLGRHGMTVAGSQMVAVAYNLIWPCHQGSWLDLAAAYAAAAEDGDEPRMAWLQYTFSIPDYAIGMSLPIFVRAACQSGRHIILASLLAKHPSGGRCACVVCRYRNTGLTCVQKIACRAGHAEAAEILERWGAPMDLTEICISGNVSLMQSALKKYTIMAGDIGEHIAFLQKACEHGHRRLAAYLAHMLRIGPSTYRGILMGYFHRIFHGICARGHLDVAMWFVGRYGLTTEGIHSDNSFAFVVACNNGYFDLAKWIVAHAGPASIAAASQALGQATRGNVEVARWLCDKYPGLHATPRTPLDYTIKKHSLNPIEPVVLHPGAEPFDKIMRA